MSRQRNSKIIVRPRISKERPKSLIHLHLKMGILIQKVSKLQNELSKYRGPDFSGCIEPLWFFRLKDTNLYYHRVNDKFDFLPGLNGACLFDKKGCEQLQFMQATGETELVLASEVLTHKCEK